MLLSSFHRGDADKNKRRASSKAASATALGVPGSGICGNTLDALSDEYVG